jgi:glutathione synthase/RimK-type ligase-like ATP-grasp enzyme
MHLRIATCRPLPEPDDDEAPLLEALAAAGVEAEIRDWRSDALWSPPLPTVVRSTWDYIHHLDAFRAWAGRVGARAALWNPADVILDNVHKRYLLALAGRGVPVVPTVLVDRGRSASLERIRADRGWGDVVIKPAVGAGSFETRRFAAGDPRAQRSCDRLAADRDVLVQPYLAAVEGHGERALVWIDGEFTHAVRKSPRFAGDEERVSAAVPISAAEREVGAAALAPLRDRLLYARVDVAPGPDGGPVVLELELVEPSLFLLQCPAALARLVAGIRRRL